MFESIKTALLGCCRPRVVSQRSVVLENDARGIAIATTEGRQEQTTVHPSTALNGTSTNILLTIPPTPDGPLEEAEKRMRSCPKFRPNESVKKRYDISRTLGSGGFAVVKLAADKSNGKRSEVFHEVEIASGANHPNIVSVKEFFISENRVSLIMDYMEGGRVLDSLLERQNGRYTEDDARNVMRQVLDGLKYLHARNVAHRDLKLENLLLEKQNDLSSVKIVDFGLSKHTTNLMTSVLGTPQFVSPEMLSRSVKTYGKYVDMWSAGVLLYIFLSGYPPFYDPNETILFKKIMSGRFSFSDPVWNSVSDCGKDLITKLLVKDPNVRFSAAEALEHSWFQIPEECAPPLQETRSNLLRLKRAELLRKAGRVVVALNRLQKSRTEENIQEMAMRLNMEDMRLPAFILGEIQEEESERGTAS